jgi:hypothetical protein
MLMVCSRRVLRRASSQRSIDAHRARSPNVAEHNAVCNADLFLDDLSAPREVPEQGWEVETAPAPEIDLSDIWDQVLRIRPTLGVGDGPESSLQGTNNAGSFISAGESERTDHSVDDDEVIYNPATNGLSPELLLKERFLVDVAKNGMSISFS